MIGSSQTHVIALLFSCLTSNISTQENSATAALPIDSHQKTKQAQTTNSSLFKKLINISITFRNMLDDCPESDESNPIIQLLIQLPNINKEILEGTTQLLPELTKADHEPLQFTMNKSPEELAQLIYAADFLEIQPLLDKAGNWYTKHAFSDQGIRSLIQNTMPHLPRTVSNALVKKAIKTSPEWHEKLIDLHILKQCKEQAPSFKEGETNLKEESFIDTTNTMDSISSTHTTSHDGRYTAKPAPLENYIVEISGGDNAEPKVLYRHLGPIHSIQWSPHDTYLATASADGSIKIWEPKAGKEIKTLNNGTTHFLAETYQADIQPISIAWSPNEQHIAAFFSNRTSLTYEVHIYEINSGKLLYKTPVECYLPVKWNKNGTSIYMSNGKVLQLVDSSFLHDIDNLTLLQAQLIASFVQNKIVANNAPPHIHELYNALPETIRALLDGQLSASEQQKNYCAIV